MHSAPLDTSQNNFPCIFPTFLNAPALYGMSTLSSDPLSRLCLPVSNGQLRDNSSCRTGWRPWKHSRSILLWCSNLSSDHWKKTNQVTRTQALKSRHVDNKPSQNVFDVNHTGIPWLCGWAIRLYFGAYNLHALEEPRVDFRRGARLKILPDANAPFFTRL